MRNNGFHLICRFHLPLKESQVILANFAKNLTIMWSIFFGSLESLQQNSARGFPLISYEIILELIECNIKTSFSSDAIRLRTTLLE